MTLFAATLVLVGAVTHAIWNLVAKRVAVDGTSFVGVYTVLSAIVVLPALAVWCALDPQRPEWSWLWAGAVSGVLHLAYALLLQRSYAVGDLNLAYPVSRGVGPLLTLVVAIAVLGEHVGPVSALGGVVIVLGIFVISWTRGGTVAAVGPGLAYGVATGVAIASYTLFDDYAVNALSVPPLPYYALNGLAQLVAFAPLLVRRRAVMLPVARAHWRAALVVAVLVPFSYVIVLVAMQHAPVALVAPLRSTSIVLASLGGWLLFKEPHPGRRLAGAAVVLLGIAGVVLG